MTFLINLLRVLSKMIAQKALEELYNILFSFEMMIDMDFLKCLG